MRGIPVFESRKFLDSDVIQAHDLYVPELTYAKSKMLFLFLPNFLYFKSLSTSVLSLKISRSTSAQP
ncbi:hypothetical protein Y032_0015g2658 [Ancylostoma ceylanicum]|uniref:Uncharacterized protein n=1 Tax=Ancylostoma ceylanicum TaxID=53326 RepID=A0A016V7P9_9BILA|nr:hypothetical protein Y032_0015g2658 [Ancylostoma ceylanicum]